MSVLFDDVSRIIAGSSSRTHALKLIGGALGGAALTFLGVGCSASGDAPALEHSSVVSLRCRNSRRCGSHCCKRNQTCCHVSGILTCCDGPCCGSSCCSTGQTCCSSTCCNSGQTCCSGEFICCNSGQICCTAHCCNTGQTCCGLHSCCSGTDCCGDVLHALCCPRSAPKCVNGRCVA